MNRISIARKIDNSTLLTWATSFLAALFFAYDYLLRITPSFMTSNLRDHFQGLSSTGLGTLSSLYFWSYVPMQIIVGVLLDHYGVRKSLLFAVILCIIGNSLFGFVDNIYVAGIGRFIIGSGCAFALVGALKYASLKIPKQYFSLYVGITIAIGMLAGVIGDYFFHWLVLYSGWQNTITTMSIMGVILFVLFWLFIFDKPSASHSNITLKPLFKQFFASLVKAKYFIVGIVGCLLFISIAAIAGLWGIPFLKAVYPTRPLLPSSLNAMIFWGWLIGSPVISYIASHYNNLLKPLYIGSFIAAISFAIILIHPQLPAWAMAILLFIFGVGCSSEVLCMAIPSHFVEANKVAIAISVINFIIMLSGMFVQPLIGWILNLTSNVNSLGEHLYTLNDYRYALILVPVSMLIAGILTFFIKMDS